MTFGCNRRSIKVVVEGEEKGHGATDLVRMGFEIDSLSCRSPIELVQLAGKTCEKLVVQIVSKFENCELKLGRCA